MKIKKSMASMAALMLIFGATMPNTTVSAATNDGFAPIPGSQQYNTAIADPGTKLTRYEVTGSFVEKLGYQTIMYAKGFVTATAPSFYARAELHVAGKTNAGNNTYNIGNRADAQSLNYNFLNNTSEWDQAQAKIFYGGF